MAEGKRFCRMCGRRLPASESAIALRRISVSAENWAGRETTTVFWLCERDSERVQSAISTICVPYEAFPDQRRVGVRERI